MHEEFQQPEKKKKLMGGLEKFALIIFLIIMAFFVADKMGCSPIEKESKIEWIN